jgi:hypothetical protein
MDMDVEELHSHVDRLGTLGCVRLQGNQILQFTHDRQQVSQWRTHAMPAGLMRQSAASRLMRNFEAVDVHRRIASLLTMKDLKDTFFFEGVDHAILAVVLTSSVPAKETIIMVLDAAELAAVANSFSIADRYLQALERT